MSDPSTAFVGSNVMERVLFEFGAAADGVRVYETCVHFVLLDFAATDVVAKTSDVRLDPRLIVNSPLYAPMT